MDIAYRAYSVNIESNISSLSAVIINCIKKINNKQIKNKYPFHFNFILSISDPFKPVSVSNQT